MDKIYSGYSNTLVSSAEYEKSVVKSARRVLQVFEFFAEYQQPASASEISINLDFPQSSTSMLLRSLVQLGYLQFDNATRLFEPSIRLPMLSAWNRERMTIAGDLVAMMEELRDATGACVLLAEPYRHYVRYIYVLQSTDPEHVFYTPHGTVRPICSTAFGQMLLTLKSEKEVRTIIHRARSDEDSLDYGVESNAVLSAVARSRDLGYAHTSRVARDLHSWQIAALIPETNERPALAIGVTAYERGTEHRIEVLNHIMQILGRDERFDEICPPAESLPTAEILTPAGSRY